MDVAFTKRTKIEKVRIAKETQYTLKGVEISKDGRNNTLIALLANGKENCCLAIPEVIAPKPVAPKPTVTKEPLRSVIEAQLFDEEGESMEAAKKREEEQRQKAKEAALAAEKAAKEAAEAEKRRKTECEELIKEAILLKEEKKYKDALKRLDKAKKMNIPEKEKDIITLEKEVKALKDENSIGTKFANILKGILDED